jgi:ribosomal protein L3
MGRETVTVQNLELVGIAPERNAMLIKGAVPGRRGGILKIRYAVKKEAPAAPEQPAPAAEQAGAGTKSAE